MSSAAVSRLIKEELLSAAHPEVYSRPIKRAASRGERKIKVEVKGEAIKKEPKKEVKRRGRRRAAGTPLNYEDEVELVRALAPRRPYQWKGRRVRKVLRPGTVVSFTPGQRSGTTTKRSYDEVYADEDILQQAAALSGEFAYGKRARLQALPLDTSNSTPGLQAITPQVAVPLTGKRRNGELQPTVQLMVPSKRKRSSSPTRPPSAPTVSVKEEEMVDVGPSSLFIPAIKPTVKKEVTKPMAMEVDTITVRPVKKVAPDVGVQTLDLSLKPKTESRSVGTLTDAISTDTSSNNISTTTARKGRPKRAYGVRYHPSIVLGPPVKRTRRSRKATTPKTRRPRQTTKTGATIPNVIYHPSIQFSKSNRR